MKLVKSEAFIYQPWLKPFILMSTPGYYGYNMVLIITMVIFNIYIYIIFYAILWSVSGENLPQIGAEVVVPILASKVAALAEDRKSRCAVVLWC
jgi:hypothetical protein